MPEEFDEFDDQYYEIYDSLKIVYELTCNICGHTYEKRDMDQDSATDKFEEDGFKFVKSEEDGNKIICPSCI